jgi:hypothetical protein
MQSEDRRFNRNTLAGPATSLHLGTGLPPTGSSGWSNGQPFRFNHGSGSLVDYLRACVNLRLYLVADSTSRKCRYGQVRMMKNLSDARMVSVELSAALTVLLYSTCTQGPQGQRPTRTRGAADHPGGRANYRYGGRGQKSCNRQGSTPRSLK